MKGVFSGFNLLIRGSPVTSSMPGFLGGANFSWYDRPLAGCISLPVTLSTNTLSGISKFMHLSMC